MEEKYNCPVIPTDCANLSLYDINEIFSKVLYEFPIERINISYPKWVDGLDNSHWLKQELNKEIRDTFGGVSIIKQANLAVDSLQNTDIINATTVDEINLGTGSVSITISLKDNLFYKVLTEISGTTINNEFDLFTAFYGFAKIKKEYDRIAPALEEVKAKGYGIITPSMDELILDEPEIVKQGSKFGIKLRAKAPSIHMIMTNVETEVSPIVGSEKQSEELVKYLLEEFESDPKKIWESNIFGKNLHELVNEGLQNKLERMPEDAQMKLQETLERIVNEGGGGLICIIL